MLYATLTVNSTTLFTYENYKLIHSITNLNCSEAISQELGLINASKTLIGSIPVSSNVKVTNTNLALYFMKKVITNGDGSNDLMTVVTIAHNSLSKTMILSVMKKIIDKYIEFRAKVDTIKGGQPSTGEFKPIMNKIIEQEERNYDLKPLVYNYGSIEPGGDRTSSNGNGIGNNNKTGNIGPGSGSDVIQPNNLLLANEEVEEVRQLMLDNINKLMSRGNRINSLVDQTDRLTTSSLVFQKKAQQIRQKMWLSKYKVMAILVSMVVFILYLIVGDLCGYPFFDRCVN